MSEKLDTEVKRRGRRAADVDGWDWVAVITVGSEIEWGRRGLGLKSREERVWAELGVV